MNVQLEKNYTLDKYLTIVQFDLVPPSLNRGT